MIKERSSWSNAGTTQVITLPTPWATILTHTPTPNKKVHFLSNFKQAFIVYVTPEADMQTVWKLISILAQIIIIKIVMIEQPNTGGIVEALHSRL